MNEKNLIFRLTPYASPAKPMADRKFEIETLCLHAGQLPDATPSYADDGKLRRHIHGVDEDKGRRDPQGRQNHRV